jgi:signal transduction histidine kinase/ligand-binding sensor domain-containing protein
MDSEAMSVRKTIMRRMAGLWLTCLVLSGSAGSLFAVEFQPVGDERGLDAKIISYLLIDRQGFLWAASREGLYRYDGYHAERFMPDGSPHSITDADIRMLYESSDGKIWVATNNGGLNVYDPLTGTFKAYRHLSTDPESLSNDSIYGITESGDGRLWVGSQIGLNRLDPETGLSERFFHDPEDPGSISNNYIFAVFRDSTGSIWISTIGGGLNRWNAEKNAFDRYDLSALTGGPGSLNDVFAIVESGDKTLWFGTRGGLVTLDAARERFLLRKLDSSAGPDHTVTHLAFDGHGKLWLSLLSGTLLEYEPETGMSRPANTGQQSEGSLLPSVPQISLAITQDMLFVGTWGSGVYAGRISNLESSLLKAGPQSNGLTSANVTSVFSKSTAGKPLVGTFNGTLEQADFVSKPVPFSTGVISETGGGVLSIERLPGGQVFAGLSNGLLEMTADLSSSIFHRHQVNGLRTLGAGYVTSLEVNSEDSLWVGVGGSGLFLYTLGSDTFLPFQHDPADANSISGNYVTAILKTQGNELWVGTRSHGLNRCQINPWKCERFSSDPQGANTLGHFHITSIYQDRFQRVWVTTSGAGLHRVEHSPDGSVSGFTRWTRRDGLISDDTMGVVEDDDETLWISSRAGLSRLNPASGRVANLVEAAAGLPASTFNTNAVDRDQALMYFGTLSGLLSIPVGQAFSFRTPAPVSLTRVERSNEQGTGITVSAHPETLSINYGELISLGFSVLDFAEVPHEYEYRMDNSPAWISLGNRREITFSGLSPGEHEIRVRGRDAFGLWSEASPFTIRVIPPFWMTAWFRLLVLMLVAMLILAAHKARMSGLEKRNRQLQALQVEREAALQRAEQSKAQMEEAFAGMRNLTSRLESAKEEERQVLSRELHDELGQMLTAAKINLQIAGQNLPESSSSKRMEDSLEMIDQMISQVRNISLSLRPPMLDEAGLAPALQYYLNALEKRVGIPINFRAENVTTGNQPETRTTVFRVVQEAVGNAIRHASACAIDVTLKMNDGYIEMEIKDDGIGFDSSTINRRIRRGEHLGLLGMYERVLGAGGSFELRSRPGEGCIIMARVPL